MQPPVRGPELFLRKEILTTGNDSKVKFLREENQSLKKEIETLKDEFGRIAAAFKSHESSCGGHKQHDPEIENLKSLEFVGAEYDDLKGRYVEAKKDLKALGEGLNFLSVSSRRNDYILKLIIWSNTVITALTLNWPVCPRLLMQVLKNLL